MKKTLLNFLTIIVIISIVFIVSAYKIQKPLLENFHTLFHSSFEIPGLDDGFIPQGITYVEKEDIFLLSGYIHKEKSASCIYVLNHGSNYKIELYKDKNTPYYGHCGGIAYDNNTVFIANDGEGKDNCIWMLSLEEVLNKKDSKIYLKDALYTDVKASTCTIHNGYLWVGEYEDGMNYRTDDSHHLSKTNTSLILAYKLTTSDVERTPTLALSVRNRIQGISFDKDDYIYLSASCGLNNSSLDVHNNVFTKEADTSITINKTVIPVWILDKNTLHYEITMPPMSEGITFKKNDLYILFESASNKYRFGKAIGFDHIYRY